MFEKLAELIQQGDLNGALYELQDEYLNIEERAPKEASNLYVLEASLWEALGDFCAEISALSRAIVFDHTNYEAFYMLGIYYSKINVNKAYLCLEMALNNCSDQEDYAVIESFFDEIKKEPGMRVRNTSIMILSYNDLELVQKCIAAVEAYAPKKTTEIVVVDNASTQEGVAKYLREKSKESCLPFKLIENSENLGFPKGCNIGARNCNEENDIFFLNNDAVLTPLALFWLRMGLYENRKVGATGALSNSASLQEIDKEKIRDFLLSYSEKASEEEKERYDMVMASLDSDDPDLEEKIPWHKKVKPEDAIWVFEKYAVNNHGMQSSPYIKTFRLTGFAVLVSRTALNEIMADGMVFDERFSPGYFEDDDLGIRIARCGFEQLICKNSFIYHNGGGGFAGHSDAMENSRLSFEEKWGVDIWGYSLPWESACDEVLRIASEKKGIIKVLDFSCGLGVNSSYIKGRNPNVYIAGVCTDTFYAGIAQQVADCVAVGDLNTSRLSFDDHSFDVVIAEKKYVSTGQAKRYLKADGEYINEEKFEI